MPQTAGKERVCYFSVDSGHSSTPPSYQLFSRVTCNSTFPWVL